MPYYVGQFCVFQRLEVHEQLEVFRQLFVFVNAEKALASLLRRDVAERRLELNTLDRLIPSGSNPPYKRDVTTIAPLKGFIRDVTELEDVAKELHQSDVVQGYQALHHKADWLLEQANYSGEVKELVSHDRRHNRTA
jgi:hypothetical protein